MNKIKYLFFLFVLIGCKAQLKPKLYGKCDLPQFACTQLLINPDNTFEFYLFYDIGGGSVLKGSWRKIENDTIILSTYQQPLIEENYYKGKVVTSNSKIKVTVNDNFGGLPGALVILNNGEQRVTADLDGIAYFESAEVKTLSAHFVGMDDSILEIDNPYYNDIEIFVSEKTVLPTYLKNVKVQIIQNKATIFWKYGEKVLKCTALKNKEWD